MCNDLTRYPFENRWAVVGFNYNTAKRIITEIEEYSDKEVLRRMRARNELVTEFTDGTLLRWVKASENSRGHRFGKKMWCDLNIDDNIFMNIIMPMYMGKRKDIIWI